jgi:hypothetical protein
MDCRIADLGELGLALNAGQRIDNWEKFAFELDGG